MKESTHNDTSVGNFQKKHVRKQIRKTSLTNPSCWRCTSTHAQSPSVMQLKQFCTHATLWKRSCSFANFDGRRGVKIKQRIQAQEKTRNTKRNHHAPSTAISCFHLFRARQESKRSNVFVFCLKNECCKLLPKNGMVDFRSNTSTETFFHLPKMPYVSEYIERCPVISVFLNHFSTITMTQQ